ncbi:conserved hypothetical protein [Magnetococcus marinus MC-1]|uniref:Phage protein, HK97 gp10 family n=1 Tax=Magnetococcus marinus (strain ATCC BAA-1437 / JCM 17883 / MC-1) TaxID=156889 RepID=A0LBA8_MAGMM|nr:hypothetical protein [Magnetococcus marinus]ABK45251.1 conserved hypothetical protein [Magnetococcus marinus MC-1]
MIRVEADTRRVAQAADNLAKQVRYATALALTRTAQDAQAEVRRRLPERFTIRTGWVAKGIRVKPAKKNDLQASVRVLDPFMALQETGGAKRSQTGDALGVPVGARPDPKSVTRPGKFPGALLKKPNHFIAPLHDDPSTHAVWRRSGRKGRKLKMMYRFVDRVEIKPRFGFMDTVKGVVESRFQKNFNEAITEAMASAH